MGAGLHGKNGLNPTTSLHIFHTYVLPVLTYGLEILLPDKKQLDNIEVFYRKSLKQILSMPTNTADVAIYTLAGVIPIIGTIHKSALNTFNKICNMDSSVEKDLADILDNPYSKERWKSIVKKAVDNYYRAQTTSSARLYSSLRFLSTNNLLWNRPHPSLASVNTSSQDISRLPTKLKLLTGTYYLQSNKAAFNQNTVDPTCLLCKGKPETIDHFLMECPALHEIRSPYLQELDNFIGSIDVCMKCSIHSNITLDTNFILDPSSFICACGCMDFCYTVEYITRKLCFALHGLRSRIIKNLPPSKRKGL
ncbi:Hypothetical predicted protein [Mytilus galloprovincialis]|uniref:Reverse transcriptase zinc-binding domain-containing protein n=1 Tax=Mytilus galloprovincialis TaxID=29158 RepID=A0A8B6EQ46_MYTGA|nr:Hypothetical predicted protein [Mytilus galloprovincialis]